MTSELVSGPDLGAGYLHQLSRDREGDTGTFTYHAQDGGTDANGPPIGPLAPLGYVHPPTPCMFGGPRCWHRRFLLPFDETPRVRQAYNRSRFVLETMLAQAHQGAPVAVEEGIRELVGRIAAPLGREGIEWYLGGSAAAWLLGSGVRPDDLDLGTSRDGVDRVAELLREFLIEPIAPTDWPGRGIVRGARAFLGSFRAGVRVEWAVPIEPGEPLRFGEWTGRPGIARLETASFEGTPVPVSRPEYALVRAAERGRAERAHRLAEFVRARGVDAPLIEALLARSSLSAAARDELRRAAGRS